MEEIAARIALQDLLSDYAGCLDEQDWAGLERVFAPEFVWRVFGSRAAWRADAPSSVAEGRAAAIAGHRIGLTDVVATHHVSSDVRAAVTGDRAKVRFNLRAYHLGGGPKDGLFEHSLAAGVFEARREDRGWLMTRLDYAILIYQGSMAVFFQPEGGGQAGPGADHPMLHGG